jgi:hypothetical protein
MMRVHRAVAVGATIVLSVFATSVLGTSAAVATAGAEANPAAVRAAVPDEMGYNRVSTDEMGYN